MLSLDVIDDMLNRLTGRGTMTTNDKTRPWRTHLVDSTVIIDGEGTFIAKIEGDYVNESERMENDAALIVKAVNAYDDMLAALKEARCGLQVFTGIACAQTIERIDAAIAKAEGAAP